jgi:hypothetical protein
MPRKTFLDGDPLPASDVNTFLMDQAVQTYATSSAQNTALPLPGAGQVATNGTDKNLQVYYDQWRSLPFAMTANDVVITGTGAATAEVTVTFPAGRFTQAPLVLATCSSNNLVMATTRAATSTAVVIVIRLTTGATFTSSHTIDYVAIQMSNPSAAG